MTAEKLHRFTVLGERVDIDTDAIDATPEEIQAQLDEYTRGERTTFDLPIEYPDTFTGRVMRAMSAIPYGETRTYGELAAELDTAAVAVGGGCGRNTVPIIVPCHRVVAADGSLRGYSGHGGLDQKRDLLQHEGAK
ncbi:methylated-DNA--[protein]-cysteine S-methyltransferase [Natronomonas sp. EA1]|uniref:methylated-DNA--[protein]-cysteine S-methyltransferase n=1 Tax=Natronomonas sp. EA1 TaxID=3421655 RepID=UPI003EB9F8A6